jgi:hypothetical protein
MTTVTCGRDADCSAKLPVIIFARCSHLLTVPNLNGGADDSIEPELAENMEPRGAK